MKKQIRSFLINLVGLWAVIEIIPGVTLTGSLQTFALVATTLYLVSFFIKPIVKIILLPINLFTLNFATLIVNTAAIFALTFIVPQFKILGFEFLGYSNMGFMIPSVTVNQFPTLVIAGIIYTFVGLMLNWISN